MLQEIKSASAVLQEVLLEVLESHDVLTRGAPKGATRPARRDISWLSAAKTYPHAVLHEVLQSVGHGCVVFTSPQEGLDSIFEISFQLSAWPLFT